MLKGLGCFVGSTIGLFLLTVPVFADSTLHINSQAIDSVGQVQQSVSTDIGSSFTTSVNPQTILYMESDTNDFIGGGVTTKIDPQTATFTVSAIEGVPEGVHINVNGGDDNYWDLYFVPPQGQSLEAGKGYYLVHLYPEQYTANAPALSVTGDHRGCDTSIGWFFIRDIKTGLNGKIANFAADF